MDRQYSWKKTEEIEIDIADLLHSLCRQWRCLIVCAIVSALVLGGYGYLKNRAAMSAASDEQEESELTEMEEQRIKDALQLKNEIEKMEEYMESSVLMQLDPYHKNRIVMLYRIDYARYQDLAAAAECYVNFLVNGGAADALRKSGAAWNIDKSCLAELISAYQKSYSFPFQIALDEMEDSRMQNVLFYVEVTGKNADTAKKLAKDIQKVIKKYSSSVQKNVGSHSLTLVSSEHSVTADNSLQVQQHDKKANLTSNRTNLKTVTDSFNEKQMKVYREAADIEKDTEKKEELASAASDENRNIIIRYVLLGTAGGIFVYVCIFSCGYIFSDTLKSIREIKRLYSFPFYGEMMLQKQFRGNDGIMSCRQNMQDSFLLLNRVRLACKKRDITKLCAVSDYLLSEQEKERLEGIASQLKGWNIDMETIENAISDSSAWDRMKESGNILLVLRTRITTHRMVDDALDFYSENDLNVIGAAAFVQNF